MRRVLLSAVILVSLLAMAGATLVSAGQRQLAAVRDATAAYHDLDAATAAGYGPFYVCTDHVTDGTMGQHYVNLDLVGFNRFRANALVTVAEGPPSGLVGADLVPLDHNAP